MSSNINPTNINGAYPVAGQDNDSQGFRDNFTNIKTNFTYAKDEISDLQSKVVLKAALTGTTLNNNMNGSVLSNASLLNMTEPKEALGIQTTATLNYAASPYWTVITGGALTVSFSNLPSAGQVARFRLQVEVTDTAYTLTIPASVTNGIGNLQGFDSATNTITFNDTGVFEFEFETSDGGSTVTIFDLNRNHDPVYLPSNEDVADAAAIDLTVTSSYFSTGASGETATLAAGIEGQIKVLAMYADGGGDMVVTVTNAGWKSSGTGTITFGDIGDACSLQYINSKWFATGANGVAFA